MKRHPRLALGLVQPAVALALPALPALLALLIVLFVASCGFLPRRASDIHQAVWVQRDDYRSESDVREIVRNCAKAGFDTVLFQVRGNGTVFYRSRLEPWSEAFGYQDPGFDPLWVACDEARLAGISLQAWVNAIPGWRGDEPPANEKQLYHAHPDWFLVDQDKRRQPLAKDYYVALNPCLPRVRDHIAAICEEIAKNYPVRGVHLDYIRFLEAQPGRDYPHDSETLRLYKEATGKTPADDPEAWSAFKTAQVTELVREIRRRVRQANRQCQLTAAVLASPERARDHHQDWVGWADSGIVDALFPMAYDSDDQRFAQTVATEQAAVKSFPLVIGIGVHKHDDPAQTLRQMQIVENSGAQGFALFTYGLFFKPAPRTSTATEASARVQRRERILPKIQARR